MLDYTNQRDGSWILPIVLCLFYLQVPGTCGSELLQIDPPSIVVQYGSHASVNCSTNITHYGMGWEASQGGVDMMENVQHITWTVENITNWDLQPICFINIDQDQNQALKNLNITIYKHPDQVSISTVNHTGPMIEGRQYELQCDVLNVAPVRFLTVTLYKGQQRVKNITYEHLSSKFPENINFTHLINASRNDDGVQYRCEAELNLGPEGPQPSPTVSSDPLNIIVHFGPEFSNCPKNLSLNEGESLEGYCTVTGNPFPHSFWERNGHPFDPDTPLNRTSSGRYTIIINERPAMSLDVQVIYGPEISCGPPYSVKENERFKPNCTVTGNPKPEIKWCKGEDEVDFSQIMYRRDAGQYILVASNNCTNYSVSHTVEIEVLYPPITISELDNERASIGENVVLKCSSKSKPKVKYEWIYHRTSNVNIKDQDGVSMLYINHTGRQNIGTYTCTAYNDLGNTSHTVRVDVQGAKATCPLSVNADTVVVEYGKSVNVTCLSTVSNARLHWKLSDVTVNGATLVINSTSFVVDFVDWNASASCHGHFIGLDDCKQDINIIVYKPPDSVSISGPTEPMIADGRNYTLECDVRNVAPVQQLTVKWYKGKDLVHKEEHFNDKNPANITSRFSVTPNRTENNMQYGCEAEQGPKSFKSETLNIAVHYKPIISEKLPRQIPVFRGYPEVLVCKASGYPKPTITWIFNGVRSEGENLTVTENGGDYTCVANNSVGNDSRVVTVHPTEDYLPLIAGFVALVVVIISVIFLGIYSIYYKNTKMGRYSVEGAKPKAQNGNVAQNGKDSTIPMKKIIV